MAKNFRRLLCQPTIPSVVLIAQAVFLLERGHADKHTVTYATDGQYPRLGYCAATVMIIMMTDDRRSPNCVATYDGRRLVESVPGASGLSAAACPWWYWRGLRHRWSLNSTAVVSSLHACSVLVTSSSTCPTRATSLWHRSRGCYEDVGRHGACRATSPFSLPRTYLIGRLAVCYGVVLPVCLCVVSFSKVHEHDTHDLLRTSR